MGCPTKHPARRRSRAGSVKTLFSKKTPILKSAVMSTLRTVIRLRSNWNDCSVLDLISALNEYFRRQIREGRVFVGFDVDDDGLGFAVRKAGRDAIIFRSDSPHEVFNAQMCGKEIDELIERIDLSGPDKAAVFGGNARRFYGLSGNGI
jgi:hypothetical protein